MAQENHTAETLTEIQFNDEAQRRMNDLRDFSKKHDCFFEPRR